MSEQDTPDVFGTVDGLQMQAVQIETYAAWQLAVVRVAQKHFGADAMRVDGPRFAEWLDERLSVGQSPTPEPSVTTNAQAEQIRREAEADLFYPAVFIDALTRGIATPEMVNAWMQHPYVCTSATVRACGSVLFSAITLERQQHQQALDALRADAEGQAELTARANQKAAALRAERDRLKEQMQFFADAKPETWDDPTDFKAWVQSRARHMFETSALTPPQEPTP